MFKKTALFVPDHWYSNKECVQLIKIMSNECGFALYKYRSVHSTDKPFTVSPKGKMEIVDPFFHKTK